MLIEFCKSKIAHGRITEAELHYEGSITIDKELMDAVDIIAGERVQVLNMNNGQRFDTYVIEGAPGSGTLCLNGPAARLGLVGDQIVVLSYCVISPEEAKKLKTKIVNLCDQNRIKKTL